MGFTVHEYVDEPDGARSGTGCRVLIPQPERGFQVRVLRFEGGNLGDHKLLGGGVWEARLAFGPGYRLYVGKAKDAVVLLLLGGDKGSQTKDIKQATRYWASYVRISRDREQRDRRIVNAQIGAS